MGGGVDVVVVHGEADAAIGDEKWLVYGNTGAGFGSGEDWALPAGYPGGTFHAFYDESTGADPGWGVFDIDGTDRIDLVVTENATIPDLGVTRWQVYRGGAGGFGPGADDWALPGGFPEGTFADFYDSGDAGVSWGLMSLDADTLVDVVVAGNDADASVGEDHWQVARGTCAG